MSSQKKSSPPEREKAAAEAAASDAGAADDDSADAAPDGGSPKRGGISRRNLVIGCAGVAATFAVGGAGLLLTDKNSLLRPPGGQDEDRLWGACIKCDRCRSACPHGAIDVAHIEDGWINARTPTMNFHLGYCDFCDADGDGSGVPRCVNSCPTGALSFGFDPYTGEDKIGMATIDYDECLLYRSGSASCSHQCLDACVYGAIAQSEDGGVEVYEDLCNGCGACENACPSASYGSYTGSDRRGVNVEVWKGQA